jgi:hypothetical protein
MTDDLGPGGERAEAGVPEEESASETPPTGAAPADVSATAIPEPTDISRGEESARGPDAPDAKPAESPAESSGRSKKRRSGDKSARRARTNSTEPKRKGPKTPPWFASKNQSDLPDLSIDELAKGIEGLNTRYRVVFEEIFQNESEDPPRVRMENLAAKWGERVEDIMADYDTAISMLVDLVLGKR